MLNRHNTKNRPREGGFLRIIVDAYFVMAAKYALYWLMGAPTG